MFANELLCFFPAPLPASAGLVLRRNRSPNDLVDFTDLLSFDYTLKVSLNPMFSIFSG